jgi:alcohol dehydrogenase class IV
MHCCQYYLVSGDGDASVTIDLPQFTFGAGCLAEAGAHAKALGLKRVAVFTDTRVARLPHVETVEGALRAAGVDVARYDEVEVEPTDASFRAAARFAAEGRFDGYV